MRLDIDEERFRKACDEARLEIEEIYARKVEFGFAQNIPLKNDPVAKDIGKIVKAPKD